MDQCSGLVQPPWDGDCEKCGDVSSSGSRDSNSESDSSVLKRQSLCVIGDDWEVASSSLVESGIKWLEGSSDSRPGTLLRVGGGSC